ncbi:hypothetical protein SCHPADRAFT_667980 [Schizopora paradoxa]|uniref:USP8 dimerisation domain-containing protein n=1 Tax=Schizopora paradoxa TaxID=27342 RepID=A0A0H2R6Q1_9AGAM|nr:hypothetical protein SCHPADRAFT_667980 [Schizopora paradoxa]
MTSHQHPASIQELAERAEQLNVWETTRDFKQWLKAAERARHAGQSHDLSKDLENAFVEYARAATLILDKIPTHKEYYTRLDGVQRDTLLTKGKQVLDRMDQIKPILIDRHNAWDTAQSNGAGPSRSQEGSRPSHPRESEVGKLRKPTRHASVSTHANGMQIWYPDAAVAAQGKRRREDGTRVRDEQHTRSEQAGIVQRQREAEAEARTARQNSLPLPVTVPLASTSSHSSTFEAPPLLPLENPVQFHDDEPDKAQADDDLYKRVADLAIGQHPASISFGITSKHKDIHPRYARCSSISKIHTQHKHSLRYSWNLRRNYRHHYIQPFNHLARACPPQRPALSEHSRILQNVR